MPNKYYTALESFQVLRAVGSKPSNTYIGASRVIDTVYETVDVLPGEEIHDLVGGTFHIDSGGNSHAIRLTEPVHIFEAKYHRGAEPARLATLLRDDFICVEDAPVSVARYRV